MPAEEEIDRKKDSSDENTQETQADFGAVLTEQRSEDDRDRQEKDRGIDAAKTTASSQSTTESGSVRDTAKTTDQQSDSKSDKSSKFGPLNLLASFGDTVGKTAQEAYKAAESLLPQMEIFSGGVKGDSAKPATDASVKTAEAGQAKIDGQLDKYFAFRDPKDGGTDSQKAAGESKQAPGDYKNEDGSSYKIDKNGDLTQLTTAPSEKFPDGQTYKATYNDKHEMVKLEAPGGKSFTRVSPENDKGFAYWQSRDANGNKTSFGNKTNDAFVGKLDLNQDGAQFMIGHDKRNPGQNTKWAGTMIEHGSDGSETRSSLHTENGKTTGFDSTVKNADGTQVQTTSKLEDGKAVKSGDAEVKSADGDTKTIIKDGKVVEKQENLIAKEKMEAIAHKLDGNDRLQNLKHAKLTKQGDSIHVSMDNYGARDQRSIQPGTVINGTKPDHTHAAKHQEFDLRHNKDGSVSMSNIQGMTGYGSALGPLGRRWHSGSSPVHEVRMVPGRDGHSSMQSLSDRGWIHASHHVLTPEAKAAADGFTGKGAKTIDFLNENTKQATIDHPSKRNFNFDLTPTEKFKEKAKEGGMPIEIGDKVSAKFSYDEKGMQLSDLKGISAFGQPITGLKIEPGKGGEMSAKAEYVNPLTGQKTSTEIPMSKAAPLLAMMGQDSLAQSKKK